VVPTIKDIARLAEVGIGTVSRVLNGGDKVKPDTAERILKIAEELGYRPNKIAQSLVRGQNEIPTLGLILPSNIREIHWEVIKGIYGFMTDNGCQLSAFKDDLGTMAQVKNIVTSSIHGLICLDNELPEQAIRAFRGARIPWIHLGREIQDQTCISINHFKGGNLAARHLAVKGVRTAAFVGLVGEDFYQKDLRDGFKSEALKRSLEIVVETDVAGGDQEGYKMTRILWERGDVGGIFFSTDDLAYGAFRFFREINQGVPIIGYGDMPASKILALSTLRYPSYSMGYTGAQTLMDMIQNGSITAHSHIELVPDLVTRKS